MQSVLPPELTNLDILRKVFTDPRSLEPGETTEAITQDVAERFSGLAEGMRIRRVPAEKAAHFLMKLMFCMFAEGVGLLDGKPFTKIVASSRYGPNALARKTGTLFGAMATGGEFGAETVKHFNGGLFGDADVIELTQGEIQVLSYATDRDWSNVEPYRTSSSEPFPISASAARMHRRATSPGLAQRIRISSPYGKTRTLASPGLLRLRPNIQVCNSRAVSGSTGAAIAVAALVEEPRLAPPYI